MVKVCIITSVHSPFDTRIFHKEAKTLVRNGYNVTIIAKHDKDGFVDGIKISPLSMPKNRYQRRIVTVLQSFIIAWKINASIYHFHDPELIPVGLLLKLFTKGMVIYDVHEDVPKQILSKKYIPNIFRYPISFLYNIFEKNASKAFNHIICATDVITNKFKKYNKKTVTVKNYISKNYTEDFTGKNYHSQKEFILVFAGSIYEERGILEAIKALNLLADLNISFVLCGPVEQGYYRLLKKEDNNDRIIYKGVLSYEDALRETFKADIGYICDHPLQRHMEGLPVKLFEYMGLGIPVVASDFPVWNSIVCEAECGLTVNPLSPEDIARAIRYFIEHEDERRRMGENGRRAIIEKYNWETEAKKLLAVYKNMKGIY